ncbi:MAG: S-layer homology domain-containing protein, partial [Clostridia bacterium]|nr:S-layer homology domain-containing protein [Clostridia bacterium]
MKAGKALLAFILVAAMFFSMTAFPAIAADDDDDEETTTATTEETATTRDVSLSDVDSTATEGKAITNLVSLGIINGYPDGTYRASNNITRAEFAVVMIRFLGSEGLIDPNTESGFEDLDTDENYAWVRSYVKLASTLGIINGFEDGTFRANDPVTYEQAIKMIVCATGYEAQALAYTTEGDWSSGYIREALYLGITKNTSTSNKTGSVKRGTVAILVNNSLDVERQADLVNDGSSSNVIIMPSGGGSGTMLDNQNVRNVTGVVTGTYVTELDDGDSEIESNHIRIDDTIYEIGFSENPNDYLGAKVKVVVGTTTDTGYYDVCQSIELVNKNSIFTVTADCYHGFDGDKTISYSETRDGKVKTLSLDSDYVVIYNGKYYDYNLEELEDTFTSGTIEFVNSDSDAAYEVVRVNSYEVLVVYTAPTSSKNYAIAMYDQEYSGTGSTTVEFPSESTTVTFHLTRNGSEIKLTDIKKWDVLNIKESPDDADGKKYFECVVTRDTVSGTVTARNNEYIEIDDKEYYISDYYLNYEDEDKPDMNAGDYVQVYLDAQGIIVAAAESSSSSSSSSITEAYAYILGLRQESENSEYDLEFKLYTTSGETIQIGTASKVTIDGTKYKATDEDILDYLEESAITANAAYGDAENVVYHQPIVYKTNASGLISTIYTVQCDDNEDISQTADPDRYVAAEERTYTSSSRSFSDFKVSSSTKIIFVPDNRQSNDDYLTYSSYSKAFTNKREYIVEAYGLTDSKTAQLVLMYGSNDDSIYTSSSPWMIVASKSDTTSGTVVKGYKGTSTSLVSVTVADDGPSISSIGKGDIIRYLVNSDGKMTDYEIWFDASDPIQAEPVSSVTEAIENRILEIHSTSVDPVTNYPSATFRLQYGTVLDILVDEDGDSVDEETITVTPTIVEDSVEMAQDGNGVVTRTIGSSVKVFYFDTSVKNGTVETDADLSDIISYEDGGDSATRVITYSQSGTLRMIYIIG